jgi:hypothetical protein
MPYRHAWLVVLLAFPLIAVAFWPMYLSQLTAAKPSMHLHSGTATVWFVLLALQSWSIHNGQAALHRTAGKLALILFPVFFLAGMWVLYTMAAETAGGLNPFYAIYGAPLGIYDLIAHLVFAGLFYQALRHRRAVQLHARYMLATPLLLIGPVTARLVPLIVPGLMMRGPEDLGKFAATVHISNGVTLVFALLLFATAPRFGKPFLIVAAAAALQSVGFEILGPMPAWQNAFHAYGQSPLALALGVSLAIGLALVWFGWQAGRPAPKRAPVPAAGDSDPA